MAKYVRRAWRKIKGYSREEVAKAVEKLERKGLIEVVGYNHGEPMYKLTEKGLEEAKKQNKQ